MAGPIKIAILAETAKAKKDVASFGQSVKAVFAGSFLAGAASSAISAVTDFASASIAGAKESAQIHRVLESQMKNMGAAARTAFSGATDFASDFGAQIGKDDDDILGVINKLSTFPAAFGKGSLGAEAMRRATTAAFDLEAAGIGNAEGNIVGLGKALDNPIKGLTALGKSGVSFTEEQKKQIKQYMKQGDLAKAQAVLLAGVETNAKGAAAAQADGMTKAQAAIAGMGEAIATGALPYLNTFGNLVSDKIVPGIQGLFDLVVGGNFTGAFRQAFGVEEDAPIIGQILMIRDAIIGVFDLVVHGNFTAAFRKAFGVEEDAPIVGAILNIRDLVMTALPAAFESVKGSIAGFFGVLQNPAFQTFAAAILAMGAAWKTYMTVMAIARAATTAFTVVQAALNAVMLANPVGLIILAIVGIVAALVFAYNRFDGFRQLVDTVWASVTAVFSAAVTFISEHLAQIGLAILGPIGWIILLWQNCQTLQTIVQTAWSAITTTVSTAVAAIVAFGMSMWAGIQAAWNGIPGFVSGIVGSVVGFFASIPGRISGAISSIGTMFTSAASRALAVVGALPGQIQGFFAGAAGWLIGAGRSIIDGLLSGIRSAFGAVQSLLGSLTSMLPSWKGPPARDRKLLTPAGKMIMKGFIGGLAGQVGAVKRTLTGVTGLVVGTVQDQLGIHSPSQVFKGIGQNVIKGLLKGLNAGNGKVAKATTAVVDQMNKAAAATNKAIVDLKAKGADLGKTIAFSLGAFGEGANDYIAKMQQQSGQVTADTLLRNMSASLKAINTWRASLDAVTKKGLPNDIVEYLRDMGVESQAQLMGINAMSKTQLATFVSLWRTRANSGGREGAKQYADDIARQVSGLSTQLRTIGQQAMRGLGKGLNDEGAAVRKRLLAIVNGMVKAAKKSLGIKSPSRVFKDIGRQTGRGLIDGLAGMSGDVKRATDSLISIPSARSIDFTPTARIDTSAVSSSAANTQPIEVKLAIDGKQLGSVIIDPLRKEVRSRGGLQATFAR